MSDLATGGIPDDALFRPRTIALMLVIGIVGFVGMLVMGAYAPDLRSGRNGGAHALSNAATGFSGIVRLAEATGRDPVIVRNERQFGSEDLTVLTPETGAVSLTKVLDTRRVKPTLIVLPKWDTVRDRTNSGWVNRAGLRLGVDPERVLAPAWKLTVHRAPSGGRPLVTVPQLMAGIRFTAPRPLQTVRGPGLEPLITDAAGNVVVGRLSSQPLYVLADPDLLDNRGMRSLANARAALALLDWLNSTGAESIQFDVTLNGLGHSKSPLQLLFEPPFLVLTLAIAAVLALLGWQAFGSFGAPRRRERALAFGKAALVDNTAMLVRKAGREARLSGRYVDVVRERAVRAFGLPVRLRGPALDAQLDRIGRCGSFTTLAAATGAAEGRNELVASARRLNDWIGEKSR